MKTNIKLMNLDSFTGKITSFQDYLNSRKYNEDNHINKTYIPKNILKTSLLDLPWVTNEKYNSDYYIFKPKEIIVDEIINFDDVNYYDDCSDEEFNLDNSYFYDE